MSLWYCPTHGLMAPSACCDEASRAEIESATTPDVITWFEAPPDASDDTAARHGWRVLTSDDIDPEP